MKKLESVDYMYAEFLAASGLNPTVSGLACGANTSSKLVDSAGSSGSWSRAGFVARLSRAFHVLRPFCDQRQYFPNWPRGAEQEKQPRRHHS